LLLTRLGDIHLTRRTFGLSRSRLPLILFAACAAGARLFHLTVGATAIRMLGGIWLFGGICMAIGASFSGAGFANLGMRGMAFLIAICWTPIFTFMAATYDGSLFALLLASTGLFLAWILPYIAST
jgi:hypothetical protein